jgi:CBS domain-containing protein
MKPVSELLKGKPTTLHAVAPDTKVFEAIQLMAQKNVGALLVMDGGKLAGIFSERDYARKVALESKNSRDTPVAEIMTSKVFCVQPTTRTKECMAIMSERGFRHLPVVDGEEVMGMLSMRDIVNDIIREHEMTISQLEAYIHQ